MKINLFGNSVDLGGFGGKNRQININTPKIFEDTYNTIKREANKVKVPKIKLPKITNPFQPDRSQSSGGGESNRSIADRLGINYDTTSRGQDPTSPASVTRSSAPSGAQNLAKPYTQEKDRHQSASLNVGVNAQAESAPGWIRLSVRVAGEVAGGALFGSGGDSVTLVFNVDTPGEVDDKVQQQINAVKQAIGFLPSQFPTSPSGIIPSQIKSINSVGLNLTKTRFGKKIGGSSPQDWSKEFNFTPVPIPAGEGIGIDLDSLPPVKIRVEVRPNEWIQNATSGIMGDRPRDTVTIPLSAFVREIRMDEFSCAQLFENAEATLDALEFKLNPADKMLDRELEALDNIRQEMAREAGAGPGARLKELSSSDIGSMAQSRLAQFRTRASNAQSEPIDLTRTRQELSLVQNEIDNLGMKKCRSKFGDRASNIEDLLGQVSTKSQRIRGLRQDIIQLTEGVELLPCADINPDIDSEIQNLRGRVRKLTIKNPDGVVQTMNDVRELRSRIRSNLEDGGGCQNQMVARVDSLDGLLKDMMAQIEMNQNQQLRNPFDWDLDIPKAEDDEPTRLTCEDVPKSLRNAVSGFEAERDQYLSTSRRRRSQEERRRLLQDGNDIVSELQADIPSRNPCKSDLMSRVNQALGEVERGETQSGEATPCSQKFPSTEQKVEEFEETILRMRGVITKGEFDNILSQSEDVIWELKDEVPEDDACREQLVERVRSAIKRVGKLNSSVRVQRIQDNSDVQQTRQTLKDLESRLNEITGEQRTDISDLLDRNVPENLS